MALEFARIDSARRGFALGLSPRAATRMPMLQDDPDFLGGYCAGLIHQARSEGGWLQPEIEQAMDFMAKYSLLRLHGTVKDNESSEPNLDARMALWCLAALEMSAGNYDPARFLSSEIGREAIQALAQICQDRASELPIADNPFPMSEAKMACLQMLGANSRLFGADPLDLLAARSALEAFEFELGLGLPSLAPRSAKTL